MPANSLMYYSCSRNNLSTLGAFQKQDALNPAFISRQAGNFGNVCQKNMAQTLSQGVPIGVENSVIKDNKLIQEQIEETRKPTNTALRVGINRNIGDLSSDLAGGAIRTKKTPLQRTSDRFTVNANCNQGGTGIFDKVGSAISGISSSGIADIVEAGSELAFGPIGTYLSNVASNKWNRNPNWRPGFPGEKHAIIDTPWGMTRANYLGPGTNLLKRLERNDPPVDGSKGLDAAAKKHDIAYGLARTATDVRNADNEFLADLDKVQSSSKMKAFVKGLFNAKKLAEDVGFLDPSKFAPDIKQQLYGMGFGDMMQRAERMPGTGFEGYKPKGSFSAENVMGYGARDFSRPLKQLRDIALSLGSNKNIEEKIEEVAAQQMPGDQLKQSLLNITTKPRKPRRKKNKKSGRGFSAENVTMGLGIPRQEKYVGHILAGNVPDQKGGILGTIASIIASVAVPELIKYISKKISKKKKT